MFDCTKCKQHYPAKERAKRACGYVRAEDLVEPPPGYIAPQLLVSGGKTFECEKCPGFTIGLPEVMETGSAWGWWDKGQLQLRYPTGAPSLLLDLIEVFNVANAEAQSYYMDELGKAKG